MRQQGFVTIVIIGIIAIIVATGVGGYILLSKQDTVSETNQGKEQPEITEETTGLPQTVKESDIMEKENEPASTVTPKSETKRVSPTPEPINTTAIETPIVAQNPCFRQFSPQYGSSPYYKGALFDAHVHMPNLIDLAKIDPAKIEGHGDISIGHEDVDTDAETNRLLCNFEREKVRGAIGFTIGEAQLLEETIAGAKAMKAKVGDTVELFLVPASFNANNLDSVISGNANVFAGFGEMAFYHPSYANTPPDSSPMLEIYKVAEKHNFIVMMHPSGRQESAVENALRQYPNVKFLIHGPEMENAIHGLIGKYPNAYYSIDTMLIRIPSAPGALMYMVSGKNEFKTKFAQNYSPMLKNTVNQWKSKIEQYPDRYMWGTDRSDPWTYDEDVSALIEEFSRAFIAKLDVAVQERFAYKNAEKLLQK